jgi:poly(beta-D-mannuronate) lyase
VKAFRVVVSCALLALFAQMSTCRAANFFAADFAQLDVAIAQALPGDTVTMASGNWTNADILFKATGAAGKVITLRAERPGHVFLTGASRLRIAGSHLAVEGLTFKQGHITSGDVIAFREDRYSLATNCRLSHCAIIDYNPPTNDPDTKWVALYGFSNRVDHCFFKGKQNTGAILVVWLPSAVSPDAIRPNDHLIDHTYFGQRPVLGANNGEAIRIGDAATSFNISRTVVEANLFSECSGEGETISNKSCENVYRHNTFVACEGALTLRHGNRCTVEGNFFFGEGRPRTGGVRIIGEDHKIVNNYFQDLAGSAGRAPLSINQGFVGSPLDGYFQVKNAIVAFNTFVNCANGLLIGLADTLTGGSQQTTLPPVNCRITNNLVYSNRNKLVDLRITPQTMTWEGNLLFGSTAGISLDTGITIADPKLVETDDRLWRPGPGSPALGAAQGDYSFVTTDADGQDRPAHKDIGCDQASDDAVTRKPLTQDDVGPAWMGLAIRAAEYIGQRFTLQWDAAAGVNYQVQTSADLVSWQDTRSVITGTNSVRRWTDDSAPPAEPPGAARFYRVKRLP